MIMNRVEFFLMNNPIRGFIQETIEIKKFLKLSRLPPGKTVLEIGCGDGKGTKLIKKYFRPRQIYAVDLDERMIVRAKKKNTDPTISFEVADVCSLRYDDNTFDAIFDFGVIHHIPNWKDCLDELKRVLKPNGELIIEDLSIDTFTSSIFGRILKKVFRHPYEHMYTREKFIKYVEDIGLKIVAEESYYPFATIKYFVLIANK